MKFKIKNAFHGVATVAISAFAYGLYAYLKSSNTRPERIYEYEPNEGDYGLAAKAISESDMWSSDKAHALQALLRNGTDHYYQAVISIANSCMWSADKLRAIKEKSAKSERTYLYF